MVWTLDKLLVEFCAPALMGVKPANLFRYSSQNNADVYQEIANWNEHLKKFGICLTVLKECPLNNSYLIYIYRPSMLEPILKDAQTQNFLKKYGYQNDGNIEDALFTLSNHLCLAKEFPHEIGVFLGYPLEDVIGFIENKGQDYVYCGYWKVYSNLRSAMKSFDIYKNCTSYCKDRYEHGDTVLELAVAM